MTFLVLTYLAAIVAANILVSRIGPEATIATAFLLIGLDLSTRDRLHEAWRGHGLAWRMTILVASGSALSAALSWEARPIAVASFAAFALAGIVDALSYAALGDRARLLKMNGSNALAALADSLVFPTLAFGELLPAIVAGQWAAKVAGGFLWSLVLTRR